MEHKVCSRGNACVHPEGPFLPATVEYFYKQKYGKFGLRSNCIECEKARQKAFVKNNRDKVRVWGRNWQRSNLDKVKEYHRKYYYSHIEVERERSKLYREQNIDKVEVYQKEYNKEYRVRNHDKILEKDRRWREQNQGKRRAYHRKRRANKQAAPHDWTEEDEVYARGYFDNCCAVCGCAPARIDKRTLAMDHWVPLSADNTLGTIPANMVPLCHGVNGCNNKKSNLDPIDWLNDQYDVATVQNILKRIELFFSTVRQVIDDQD